MKWYRDFSIFMLSKFEWNWGYCHVYSYPFVDKFLAEVLGTVRSSIYQNYTWKHYAWDPCLTCYQNYTWKHLFTTICYIFQSAQNFFFWCRGWQIWKHFVCTPCLTWGLYGRVSCWANWLVWRWLSVKDFFFFFIVNERIIY